MNDTGIAFIIFAIILLLLYLCKEKNKFHNRNDIFKQYNNHNLLTNNYDDIVPNLLPLNHNRIHRDGLR